VSISEAKAQFSRLLLRVATGEEITITNRGVPVARLISVPGKSRASFLGMYRGKFVFPDDFNAPLPDDILDLFEGKDTQARKKA